VVKYPTSTNLSYFWNFGIFALVALILQIVSGILLVMHYTPNVDYAFISCDHIMRDVNYGWTLRYSHANGASIFFIVVYAHILRGLIYGSYLFTREPLWCSGVIIFLLMIITAFLGYILPWGQMSLWGATVITNLASTIPAAGDSIVLWLWGGFSVANPTLQRFFSLHFVFPFLILGFVGLHIFLLHNAGSSNPLGIPYTNDKTTFTPYYTIKDVYSLFIFFMIFTILVFFMPNALGHPDNSIPANSNVTPEHIVPEWYFLPFYAILRAIPDKALGVLALLMSIVILLFLPYIHSTNIRSALFKPGYKVFCFSFIAVVFLLGYLGAKPIEEPFLSLAQSSTMGYFTFFNLLPFIERLDQFVLWLINKLKPPMPKQPDRPYLKITNDSPYWRIYKRFKNGKRYKNYRRREREKLFLELYDPKTVEIRRTQYHPEVLTLYEWLRAIHYERNRLQIDKNDILHTTFPTLDLRVEEAKIEALLARNDIEMPPTRKGLYK
jgi:ubiquinol-cytochrome c reductase cytochrome b subunit